MQCQMRDKGNDNADLPLLRHCHYAGHDIVTPAPRKYANDT